MKKHILRLVGALFIITAIIMTMIPMGSKAYNAGEQGFMMEGSKLVKYSGTATAVSIPVGVTEIGSEAFAYNKNITSVSFPNTLKEIEGSAFTGCKNITSITLPEGLESLGSSAFSNCTSLSHVKFPSSLKDLGYGIFANCDMLSTIDIQDSNKHLSCLDGALYDFDKTILYQVLPGRTSGQYIMPDTVTAIGRYAFWGCDNVTSVHIGSTITEIGDYAFSNASGLISLTLPYNIRTISQKAFEDCINMTEIIIPMSVTNISDTAFDGCVNLNMITEKGSTAEAYAIKFNENKIKWKEYEESISRNTIKMYLEEDKNNESNNNSDTLNQEASTVIYVNPASNVENFVDWDVNSPGVLGRTKIVSGKAVVFMTDSTSNIGTTNTNDSLSSTNVSDGNTLIYKAFYQDQNLTNYDIPSSIRNIDDFAFARSNLTSIDIPYGVERIGSGAFYHCDNLSSVSIPSSVTEIESDAFSNTPWLSSWKSNADNNLFLIVGDGILISYKGSSNDVNIPSEVKVVGPQAFKNHTEITNVSIPDSTQIISEDAFYGCSGLNSISGMNGVVKIEDRAFYGCPIDTIRIPATVQSIGLGAFGGTNNTSSVVFAGNKLPSISYEESSTRLSTERKPVFDQIHTFIIQNNVSSTDLSNTVIDPELDFFDGVVYKTEDTDGKLVATVIASSKPKDETEITKEISAFGQNYSVENIISTMIYGSEDEQYADSSLQGLLQVNATNIQADSVFVSDQNSLTKLNGYHMYISNGGTDQAKLISAIEQYYGNVNDQNSLLFDISLYDQTDTIPIKEFGKNRITVSIPIPAYMLDSEICAVTIGKNGTPEVILCTVDKINDKDYATFDIGHCSAYALYAPEGELKKTIVSKVQNSSGSNLLDSTPNTGDHTPIYFVLALGIGCFGLFMLLCGIFSKKIMQD